MSGNKRKRKDNPTSLSELDPVALINRRNQSVDIQEPGSTPPALQSVTFRPATFQPQPAYKPTTLQPYAQPYAQEFGCTPLALQSATFRPTTFQQYALGPMFQSNTTLLDMLGTFGPPRQLQQQQQQQQQSSPHQSTQQQSSTQQTTQQQSSPQQTTQQQSSTQQSTQQQSTQDQEEEQYHTVHRSRRTYNPEVKYSGKKLLIYPGVKGKLEPCTYVSPFITLAIKTVYKNLYPTFAELIKVEGVKKEMFEVLSKHCMWEAHHHEDIENNLYHVARLRLKDLLYDERMAYKVKHDPPEKPYRPNWIGEEAWQKLLHYWENDETFKKRSQANKGNRNLGKRGCLHTQGSVGVFSHAQHLIKEKGPNVDISDIHKETHIRKSTGGYVDTRSETTQRLYDEKIDKFLEKHPEYSNHDAIPRTIRRDIWQEVSGPGTKNTKYGFGKLAINIRHENLVHIPTPEERCRPVALPAAAQAEIEKLTRELQATKEELNRRDQQDQERHQMLQEEIRRVREEQTRAMDQQRREVGAYIRELLASSSRNVPIDETNPQEDSTNSNNEDMGAN
ncbi:uridine/cytidine kinase [Trifolium repens]|nr:uridine/cytidine kinase [Trifolium repens]